MDQTTSQTQLLLLGSFCLTCLSCPFPLPLRGIVRLLKLFMYPAHQHIAPA